MTATERRQLIVSNLKSSTAPVSAAALAKLLGVSRQIIVSDVALLRAGGLEITATSKGYVLEASGKPHKRYAFEGILACRHTADQLRDELYTIVDFGAEVFDVTIEHTIYGEISGSLNLLSRYDVDMFCEKIQASTDLPLSMLTEGVHLHKIGCRDEETFKKIKDALNKKGILISD